MEVTSSSTDPPPGFERKTKALEDKLNGADFPPLEGTKQVSLQQVGGGNWSEKLSTSLSSKGRAKLTYFPPSVIDGKIRVECPKEVVEEGELLWIGCLVGCLLDKRLPFSYVKEAAYRMWNPKGLMEIQSDGERFYFRFLSTEDKEKVLDEGPWFFGGGLMVLKEWTPEIEASKHDLTTIPIWAKLFNVPKHYWTHEGLSYIGSGIGKPLHLDRATEERTRISFARICVEVNTQEVLPDNLELKLGNGKYTNIYVEYPWIPSKCSNCLVFGHNEKKCTKNGGIAKTDGKPLEDRNAKRVTNEKQKEKATVPGADPLRFTEEGWIAVDHRGRRRAPPLKYVAAPITGGNNVTIQDANNLEEGELPKDDTNLEKIIDASQLEVSIASDIAGVENINKGQEIENTEMSDTSTSKDTNGDKYKMDDTPTASAIKLTKKQEKRERKKVDIKEAARKKAEAANPKSILKNNFVNHGKQKKSSSIESKEIRDKGSEVTKKNSSVING